jgi:membrane protein DedA with SNARE-associated domain
VSHQTLQSLPVLASVSGELTNWISHHGVYAVFLLMAVDALLPVGGELIMLYAGVLAAGVVGVGHASLLGATVPSGLESYVILALAGSLGYLLGALIGWTIGATGGRGFIERHGRLLHTSPQTLARAEGWFERHGSLAVFLGRITPVVRSFISIPAGALGSPIRRYTILTLLGSLVWCFAFAGVGWALGGTWESFHHNFRYADYAVLAALLTLAAVGLLHRRRAGRTRPAT